MPRLARALVLASLAAACSKAAPEAAPVPVAAPAGPAAWADARTLEVAAAQPAPERTERLQLRHEPDAGPGLSHLKLVYLLPEGEQVLVDEQVPLTQRDAVWSASCRLAAEPAPGVRRAVSVDGGKTFQVLLPLGSRWSLCPHESVASAEGAPDWAKMPTLERWAAGVLETAVWGCDAAGRGCQARSMAALPVHHGDPATALLAVPREAELHQVLSVAESLKVDRLLAAALLDAALNHQAGLDEAELQKLGRLAGKALGPEGPLAEDERKAMRLRVTLAREELKKAPRAQLSPRVSIAALVEALDSLPQAVGEAK